MKKGMKESGVVLFFLILIMSRFMPVEAERINIKSFAVIRFLIVLGDTGASGVMSPVLTETTVYT